jgi:beta-lactamase superfamily II metal-dependent hydrolase
VSATLRVRVYNVRFGDAILVTVPDRDPKKKKTTTRRILIDVGNAPLVASTEGGDDSVFKPVIENLIEELDGAPIDLYVMTHEHLDHVQGLPHADKKSFPNGELAVKLPVHFAWLTASAHEDYYDTHPQAAKEKKAYLAMYDRIERHLKLAGADRLQPFQRFLAINNPASTKQCVEFLRTLATKKTSYVHRSVGKPVDGTPLFKVKGTHPFKEVKFEIWAPEEDTSDYYGKFQPLALADVPAGTAAAGEIQASPLPPAGVDAGAFYNLVDSRLRGVGDNMLAIDKAANDTSVVFSLEWRGWRLLFAGDAEIRSWKTMHREGVLKPVHFLKVSHHGSHNGTPEDDVFDAILPKPAPDNRKRRSAISTWTETYPGIPHDPTNTRLKSRCQFFTTLDHPDDLFYELEFPG